jgi:hypothetical protein
MSGSKLGWNHPVCLICQYFMSGLKLLDGITLYASNSFETDMKY